MLHSLNDGDVGPNGTGTIAGGFAHLAVLRPSSNGTGIGLAIGIKAITDPDYDLDN